MMAVMSLFYIQSEFHLYQFKGQICTIWKKKTTKQILIFVKHGLTKIQETCL